MNIIIILDPVSYSMEDRGRIHIPGGRTHDNGTREISVGGREWEILEYYVIVITTTQTR